jgi:hypothetical protein
LLNIIINFSNFSSSNSAPDHAKLFEAAFANLSLISINCSADVLAEKTRSEIDILPSFHNVINLIC